MSSTLGSSFSEYLGPAQGITLPSLAVNKEEIPPDLDPETITIFTDMYKKHLTRILDCIINLNFTEIEKIWVRYFLLQISFAFFLENKSKNNKQTKNYVSRISMFSLILVIYVFPWMKAVLKKVKFFDFWQLYNDTCFFKVK